ncbi:hypothetical protein AWY79_01150 [Pseudodesulfovibrio indicus]|uniref:Rhodanese domain-containing protein n=1 Tax=Pseudodesulfovibrio indicus TaxID=1716143 RepID=A0ABM5YRI6_9BACT|nr:hypothetical protein AWY79_01150 [Pseudodesulfovibrio indicus]
MCFLPVRPALADETEIWWASAQAEADRDGYLLLDDDGLRKLVDEKADMVLLDARADYEFAAGHLPGAANLEFDLGDDIELPQAKRQALQDLLGPDKDRMLVVYCRSFR